MSTDASSTSRVPAQASTSRSTVNVAFVPPKRNASGVSLQGKERAWHTTTGTRAPAVVTYRHVLGKGDGGPGNPLRCIAHIDIDAAYAAFEMARLGIDPKQPLAVQQWNGLIAVNYPARAFGITRHEPPAEALKKCPDLMMVHVATYRIGDPEPGYWEGAKPETHKVSLDPYRRESLKILKVFSEFCPVVEKASIDESYMDATMPVRAELLKRFPQLGTIPDGKDLDSSLPSPSELGVKLAWTAVGNLIPISGQKKDEIPKPHDTDDTEGAADGPKENPSDREVSPVPEQVDEDEDVTWPDVALYLGAELVMKCRSAVQDRLGYTCSAGIASNKMLAKLCSAWKKPNNQTILRNAAVPAFLRPMPFQKIRNLGGKLGNQVSEAYGANTVGDLLDIGLPEMQAKLGDDSGTWLWEIIRGIDYTEVEAKTQVKSMISSKNFRPYITKYGEALHWISILATELHLRLAEARELSPGLWPKTLVFSHRSPDYVVRSHQAAFPFTSKLDIAYITKHGEKLLKTAIGENPNGVSGSSSKTDSADTKIGPYNNMMLSLTGLDRAEEGQKAIENFFKAGPIRSSAAGAAVVAGGGGSGGKNSKTDSNKRKAPSTEDKASSGTNVKKKVKQRSTSIDPDEVMVLQDDDDDDDAQKVNGRPGPAVESESPVPTLPTLKCARCQRMLSIPETAIASLRARSFAPDEVQAALQREQDEHADWHFARDMLDNDRKQDKLDKPVTSTAKKKKANTLAKKDSSSDGSGKTSGTRGQDATAKASGSKRKQGQRSLTSFFGQ